MTNLSTKFGATDDLMTSIGDEAHSQRESILTTLSDIQTALASIDSDMLLMKRSLLAAVSQQDPCATCPPPSLITPPTDTTTNPIDTDKCKRVQALLHAISEIAGVIGAVTNSALVWSPSVVTSGISEVVTTLITGGTVPLPSFGEAASIASDAITYGVLNIGRGDDLKAQFDSVSSSMIDVLYTTSSPGAAQSAFGASMSSSGLPDDEIKLLTAIGFNALFSYFLDPASSPDLTGFDGSVCSFPSGTCFTVGTLNSDSDGGSHIQAVGATFGPFAPETGAIATTSGPVTWTPGIFYSEDPNGWTYEVLVGHAQLLHRTGDPSSATTFTTDTSVGVDGTPHAFPASGTWALLADVGGSVRICKL